MGLAGLSSAVESAAIWWATGAFVATGLWGFFILFPRRLTRSDAPAAVLAAFCALALSALLHLGSGSIALWESRHSFALAMTGAAIDLFATAGMVAVALLLPIRAARAPPTERGEVRALGIVAIGVVLFTAGTLAHIGTAAREGMPLHVAAFDGSFVLLPALLWLRVTTGPHSSTARTVLVASAAIYLGSLLVGPDVAWAAGRLLGGLVLAYAVLRGHIEGLEIKARFAISKSTIAAAFVLVFFLASEGAQILFGQGNEWVGLLAAGALVFALAPLQRAAERLAERAVPVVAPAAPSATTAEETFRGAVARLLHDGALSRDDERLLARLAADLGIDARRAFEAREAVEAELAARRDAAPVGVAE